MVYSPTLNNSMPIPTEPGILSVHLEVATATKDVAVYVPWKTCRLSYAYSVLTGSSTTTGQTVDVDLELNAAGGTEMMSINHAAGSAVGSVAEGSVTTKAACKNLDRANADRDAINIEHVGSIATTVMLYMYFEPEVGQAGPS